ncbi:MAG: histidine kinase [Opitutae bacterium]|nr:histidine kinase [Opitutae bacterium]
MITALLIVSVAALAVALYKQAAHRRALRLLEQAIAQQQPFLREDLPGARGREWDELCTAANGLIAEATRLRQLGAGQLAQLEATLGSLQEAVLIVDENNCIQLANRALQAIFPHEKIALHQRLELLLHSREFLACVEAVRAGQARPAQAIEFVEGAESVWLEVTGTLIPPLGGQKGAWALFVLHDITRQRKLEAVRKDFVANVSHELRTPLSMIKGYVETLVDSHRTMAVEDRERFLQTVQRHADRLHALVEDLLALSRLESANPGLQCEPTELGRLLGALVEDYRGRPTAAGHRLEFAAAPELPALALDPRKFTQAVENLLDNALKYTPAGTRIAVAVARRGGEIEVSVRDDGPGIPAEDLPRLFERFYRVDKGRSRDKGGTGLGLSIVKHIVQLHGGRVRVESAPGQGSGFFLTLPLQS